MPKALIITIDFVDEEDADWIRNRAVPAVEEAVQDAIEENRVSEMTSVSWEYED